MIEHLVLFKAKPETSPEAMDRMMAELRALRKSVPSIRELTCGPNFSHRSQGYTHGLFVRFSTRADLENYLAHPAHQRVVSEFVHPAVEGILALDFEA